MRYEPSPASLRSSRQPGWQLHPQGIDSSPARTSPWSVIGKTRRSKNPCRDAGVNLSAVDRVTGLDYSADGGHVILILYDLEPR
jgi:hypothetical protein